MSNRASRVPSYRLKKSNGRRYAVVSLPDGAGSRRDILLGQYGSKESWAEYARVIAEWETAGRRLPEARSKNDLTVNELVDAFWFTHAVEVYRLVDGTPTKEQEDFKLSLRPLKSLYGYTRA